MRASSAILAVSALTAACGGSTGGDSSNDAMSAADAERPADAQTLDAAPPAGPCNPPPLTARAFDAAAEAAAVGPGPGCGERFCGAEREDALPPDAHRVHVDAAAAAPGDGTEAQPFPTLAAALVELGGRAGEIRLAAGTYACPGALTAPIALIGSGAGDTRLVESGAPCVSADGVASLALANLTVSGRLDAVRVRGARRVRLRDVRVLGLPVACDAAADSAGSGLRLEDVNTAEVLRCEIRDQEARHVVAVDSGLVIRASAIGPGAGAGVLVGPGADLAERPTCEGAPGPVCPYSGYLQIEDSVIEGVGGRGIEADHGIVRLRHARVVGVTDPADAAIGVHLVQCLVTSAQDSVIEDIQGHGLVARSSRGFLQALRVGGASAGGIDVDRLPPLDDLGAAFRLRPFPQAGGAGSPLYPEPQISPPPAWSAYPEAFAGVNDYPEPQIFPGGEWFSADTPLPSALQAGQASVSDEIALHRWARLRLDDVQAEGNVGFGVRLAGHAAYLNAVSIRRTEGADSTALRVVQREGAALESTGASVVALSQIRDIVIEDNAGQGVAVYRALLFEDHGGVTQAFPATRLVLQGGSVSGNGAVGVAFIEAAADLVGTSVRGNHGIGVWVAGAFSGLVDNAVEGTLPGNLAGREGDIVGGDGVVVQGTERWRDYSADVLSFTGNRVTGSARAGLLVVSDRFPIGGSMELRQASFSGNQFDAVAIGVSDALDVSGDLPLTSVESRDLPPPAEPNAPAGL